MFWRALLVSLSIHLLLLLSSRLPSPGPLKTAGRLAVEVRSPTPNDTRYSLSKESSAGATRVQSRPAAHSSARSMVRDREHGFRAPGVRDANQNALGQHSTLANAPESVSSEHANETVLTSPQEEALRQYRLTLAREARRFSQFLVRAREQGWSGIVTLRIRLQPGIEPDISLGRSSGHEVLDGQAAGLVASAIRTAMLPEALLGRSLSFDLAIRYALDD